MNRKQNGELFENTNDIHTFYQCSNGNIYLLSCPLPLVWYQQYQRCDRGESEASCQANIDRAEELCSAEISLVRPVGIIPQTGEKPAKPVKNWRKNREVFENRFSERISPEVK
ncbi:unnamed protein product [Didymodactylos carnosus]|uniref:Chitin-binding type-2 domain-containing protein n=1 Tax=Didymodactylos carnosus TaxID=1234261 RepID=A0A814E7N6_9BILA|nr:unnamed protein product [Didymodactylos carnosus]CAF3741540.1 unnamed protein product [Didymodactylos carnosus]